MDIMWNLPKKRLFELKDARLEQLEQEKKELDAMSVEQNRNNIREQILAK